MKQIQMDPDQGLISSTDDEFELPVPATLEQNHEINQQKAINNVYMMNAKSMYNRDKQEKSGSGSRLEAGGAKQLTAGEEPERPGSQQHRIGTSYYFKRSGKQQVGQIFFNQGYLLSEQFKQRLKPSKFLRQKMNSQCNISHLSPNRSLRNYFEANTLLLKSKIYKRGDQYVPAIDTQQQRSLK